MPRPEYYDATKATINIEKVEPAIKEDFLDISHKLDKPQREVFAEIVRFYYTRNKVRPRPSRKK